MQSIVKKIQSEDVVAFQQRHTGTVIYYAADRQRATEKSPMFGSRDIYYVDHQDVVQFGQGQFLISHSALDRPLLVQSECHGYCPKGRAKELVEYYVGATSSSLLTGLNASVNLQLKKFAKEVESYASDRLATLESDLVSLESSIGEIVRGESGLEVTAKFKIQIAEGDRNTQIKTGAFEARLLESSMTINVALEMDTFPIVNQELQAWLLSQRPDEMREKVIKQVVTFLEEGVNIYDYAYHFEEKVGLPLKQVINDVLGSQYKRVIRGMRFSRQQDISLPPENCTISHRSEMEIFNQQGARIPIVVQHALLLQLNNARVYLEQRITQTESRIKEILDFETKNAFWDQNPESVFRTELRKDLESQLRERVKGAVAKIGYEVKHILILLQSDSQDDGAVDIVVEGQFDTATPGIQVGLKVLVEADWPNVLQKLEHYQPGTDTLKRSMQLLVQQSVANVLRKTLAVDFYFFFFAEKDDVSVANRIRERLLTSLEKYHLANVEVSLIPQNSDLQVFLRELQQVPQDLSMNIRSFHHENSFAEVTLKITFNIGNPVLNGFENFFNKSQLKQEKFLALLKRRLNDLIVAELQLQNFRISLIITVEDRRVLLEEIIQPIADSLAPEFGLEIRIVNLSRSHIEQEGIWFEAGKQLAITTTTGEIEELNRQIQALMLRRKELDVINKKEEEDLHDGFQTESSVLEGYKKERSGIEAKLATLMPTQLRNPAESSKPSIQPPLISRTQNPFAQGGKDGQDNNGTKRLD
jgi:hypothetical protein